METFKHLKPFLKRHWPAYIFGTLLLIVIDGLQLVTPIVIGNFTDALTSGELTQDGIFIYIAYILIIAIGVAIGRYGWRMTIIAAAKKMEYWLRNKVFEHLERMSLNYFNHHKTGDLMAHCTNDITSIRNAFGPGVIMMVDAFFMGIMTIALMAGRISLRLTLVALIPLPLIAILIIILGKYVRIRFQNVQEAFSDLTDKSQEAFSGIRIIKSFVQEKESLKNFNACNQDNFVKNMQLVKLFGFVQPMVGFIALISTLVALVYGGHLVIDGVISIGDLVAFLSFVGMLSWPMMALGFVYHNLQRGVVSLKRINNILDTPPEIMDLEAVEAFNEAYALTPSVEIKNMTFAYPNTDIEVLKDISLKLEPGKTLAIVGKTGSGKTTLVNLLLRLYEVEDQTIFIGGKDINKLPIKKVRDMMGYVPQDNFLFSRPITYNLKFGDAALSEEAIIDATKTAGVYEEIMQFPKGFKTELGERGVNMSGGQKQRVSIARALAKKPEILILDDSLSAVDTKTEESILTHLKEVSKDTTTILIAHRISTIQHADEIIVLDEGLIKERGTHSDLLQMKGLYMDLYQKQLLEEKLSKE